LLEGGGECGRVGIVRGWGNGCADADFDAAGVEPSGSDVLLGVCGEVVEAYQCYGEDRHARLLCEQANPGTKGVQSTIAAACSFGKDEHGVAAVHGLASVGKAAAEPSCTGQREYIEQRGDEEVGEWAEEILEDIGLVARAAEVEQHLAGHGGGYAAAQARRKRVEDEGAVVCGDVVADDQEGSCRLQVARQ
jgi:hypothetical protein